jgi:anti-sigma B factor antagonist
LLRAEPHVGAPLRRAKEPERIPCRRLVVRGALDLSTAPAVKAELLQLLGAGPVRILVELTGLVDSSGLAVLMGANRRVRRLGGSLVVLVGDPHVTEKFSALGLDCVLTIVSTEREALVALGGVP